MKLVNDNSSGRWKVHSPHLIAFIAILSIAITTPGYAEIQIGGMLRSATSAAMDTELDLLRADQTARITIEGWTDMAEFSISPDFAVQPDGTVDLAMHEAWIDLFFDSVDVRIGKQAVVWGTAEGAFITDIVSPRDLSDFILPDFDEIRIGVPAARLDWYAGPLTIEAVWLPAFVPTVSPDSSSVWYRPPDTSALPVTPTFNTRVLPAESLFSSEIFAKASWFGSRLNAEIMGGYAWDDMPVLELSRTFSSPGVLSAISATPTHERLVVTGGSASTTVGGTILRAESAVYLDRAVNTRDATVQDGIAHHTQVHYLAGVDWSLLGMDWSAQWIQDVVLDYSENLLRDEWNQTATMRVRDSYFSDRLTWQLFGYVGVEPWDALVRPSVTCAFADGVELSTGADIFLGDSEGQFGKYAENDLITLEARFYF